MLTISQISKSYGGRTLFEDVSLQVNRGDRMGLVGPNGAGKSTLFSLILKQNSPDTGSVNFEKNTNVGFLAQETAPTGDETVLQVATAISEEIAELQKILHKHEVADSTGDIEYHDAQERFIELGGYQLEPKAKKILSGLAFRESDFDRPAREMSGGWVMRAHLARLLVMEPDLLMLDEPTNHLDLESLGWFQNYLKSYPGSILMISHDREFLNELVDSIIEIRSGKLHRYRGNYDSYLEQRTARAEQHLAAYKNQQKEIQALQEFADRFRAKASKASQAQSKLKQIDRMEKIEAPEESDRRIKFRFPQPRRSGQRVIQLKNIHQAYGSKIVYEGIDFEVERGARTVLVGPNGAGKSTLLKILAGVLPFQQGNRELGHNTDVGYYSQNRVEMLQPNRTILEEVMDTRQPVPEQTARTVLGSFLFSGDDAFKRCGVLSGGEKSRLALVKLLLDPPNFLLMDEPTTHLDMASIDALIDALKQFEGTLVFISHDVYFIKALANSVLHINTGKLTPYAGDYLYYLEKSKATSARAALVAGEKVKEAPAPKQKENSVFKSKEQKRLEAEERQAKAKARKDRQGRVDHLEKEIVRLEAKQKEVSSRLEDPSHYENGSVMDLNRELIQISQALEKATREWEAAAAELESTPA